VGSDRAVAQSGPVHDQQWATPAVFQSAPRPREATKRSRDPDTRPHLTTNHRRLDDGTYNLFRHTLPKFGIEASFADDPDDLDAWRAAIRPSTEPRVRGDARSPRGNVPDVRAVADISYPAGVSLIVTTACRPLYLLRPIEYGADIVVHLPGRRQGPPHRGPSGTRLTETTDHVAGTARLVTGSAARFHSEYFVGTS
jgi:hypothetical protein